MVRLEILMAFDLTITIALVITVLARLYALRRKRRAAAHSVLRAIFSSSTSVATRLAGGIFLAYWISKDISNQRKGVSAMVSSELQMT